MFLKKIPKMERHEASLSVDQEVKLSAHVSNQRGPTMGPRAACSSRMEFVRHAEQVCRSLVDYKQRQPFFLENAMILGRK